MATSRTLVASLLLLWSVRAAAQDCSTPASPAEFAAALDASEAAFQGMEMGTFTTALDRGLALISSGVRARPACTGMPSLG